jgi:hypothetical protein
VVSNCERTAPSANGASESEETTWRIKKMALAGEDESVRMKLEGWVETVVEV